MNSLISDSMILSGALPGVGPGVVLVSSARLGYPRRPQSRLQARGRPHRLNPVARSQFLCTITGSTRPAHPRSTRSRKPSLPSMAVPRLPAACVISPSSARRIGIMPHQGDLNLDHPLLPPLAVTSTHKELFRGFTRQISLSRKLLVVVQDESGQPVAGVTVKPDGFRLRERHTRRGCLRLER